MRSDCFDRNRNKRPAYECSGLIIRGVYNGGIGRKYAWSKTETIR